MSDKKHAILIGCVGKPNAGKSSFLNACTDAKAKVGNYPFTTIDPNQGVAYYSVNYFFFFQNSSKNINTTPKDISTLLFISNHF